MNITLYWGVRNYSDRLVNEDLSKATYKASFGGCNFAANDGVETTLTVNTGTMEGTPASDLTFPSYLTADDGTQWFVVNSVKTRQGQLVLTLRRDLLGEHWNELQGMPFLCRKATDVSDPTLSWVRYMNTASLNQIKDSEEALTDRKNGKGWIVGYIDKDFITRSDSEGKRTEVTVSVNENRYDYDYLIQGDIEDWEYYDRTYRAGSPSVTAAMHIITGKNSGTKTPLNVMRGSSAQLTYDESSYSGTQYRITFSTDYEQQQWDSSRLEVISDIGTGLSKAITAARSQLPSDLTAANVAYLDGKIIAAEDADGNITRYLISVTRSTVTVAQDKAFTADMFTAMREELQNRSYDGHAWFSGIAQGSTGQNSMIYSMSYMTDTVTVTKLADHNIICSLRANRTHTDDVLYDVFAIPLGGTVKYSYGTHTADLKTDGLTTRRVMLLVKALYDTFGSYLYDLQLLPYCLYDDSTTVYGGGDSLGTAYSFSPIYRDTLAEDNVTDLLIWLPTSQASKHISYSGLVLPESTSELRIWNEEHLVRLCSPNYASQFEFSPVKNGGLEGFDIYMAFKPYTPYVRIAPQFSGLYGSRYNDGRGLVLSGDFSLDRTDSAWENYKLQNKNYELIFNRQIQSMDLKNELADRLDRQAGIESAFGAVTGTLQGIAQGAVTGVMAGGAYGALGGAVTGGIASAAGGLADVIANAGNRRLQKAVRDDARQAAVDQFQYQIGNIRALPETLTRVSVFTPDYRVYPMLEIYVCTAEDDANLRAAVRWNGFDVSRMTQLSAFKEGYVSGSIMRFSGMNVNAVEEREMNSELEQGVYLT